MQNYNSFQWKKNGTDSKKTSTFSKVNYITTVKEILFVQCLEASTLEKTQSIHAFVWKYLNGTTLKINFQANIYIYLKEVVWNKLSCDMYT